MKKIFAPLIVLALILSSCGEGESGDKMVVKEEKSTSTGKTSISENKGYSQSTFPVVGKVGMMALVCDDKYWSEDLDKSIDSVFGQYFRPYYPPQKKFSIYHLTPSQFDKRNKRVRNLMFLQIDKSVAEGKPQVNLRESYYSQTQMATYITAHNVKDLQYACDNMLWDIFPRYDKMAWRREVLRNVSKPNKFVEKAVQEKFDIELNLPKNASISSKRKNFVRISFPDESRPMDLSGGNYQTSRTNFIQYGVMIWQYPYTDSSMLEYETMLKTRDTVLKYNVPHEFDGVYMGTQYHPAVVPIRQKLTLNNIEGYEMTGLFKFTGDSEPSGGMFWSFTFLHPKTDKIITISGFVDVLPITSAVPFIRRIQAIIYSLKFDE